MVKKDYHKISLQNEANKKKFLLESNFAPVYLKFLM